MRGGGDQHVSRNVGKSSQRTELDFISTACNSREEAINGIGGVNTYYPLCLLHSRLDPCFHLLRFLRQTRFPSQKGQ